MTDKNTLKHGITQIGFQIMSNGLSTYQHHVVYRDLPTDIQSSTTNQHVVHIYHESNEEYWLDCIHSYYHSSLNTDLK